MIPNSKITATGIGGIIVIIVMGIVGQIVPEETFTFSEEVVGFPLSTWLVAAGMWITGYIKEEKS